MLRAVMARPGPGAGLGSVGSRPDCAGWGRLPFVRLTDFWDRMEQVFGPAYARSWAHDVVLPPLGGALLAPWLTMESRSAIAGTAFISTVLG